MARAYAIIDKTQAASTQSVRDRSNLVTKWKCTIERAIAAMIQEITALGEERLRLKQSLVVLGMPYSIGMHIYRSGILEIISMNCSY